VSLLRYSAANAAQDEISIEYFKTTLSTQKKKNVEQNHGSQTKIMS